MAHFYLTRRSPKGGDARPVEILESEFPPELLLRRPDQDDAMSTQMTGYAMARVGLAFRDDILAGRSVYSVISDEWRVKSWVKEP